MNFWYLWSKALGEKHGKTNKEADYIALIRTVIVIIALITNITIMAYDIKHWN